MKAIKYVTLGGVAFGLGWTLAAIGFAVYMGYILNEEDWDEEDGGFHPEQVVQRLRAARDRKLFEAFDRWDDVA